MDPIFVIRVNANPGDDPMTRSRIHDADPASSTPPTVEGSASIRSMAAPPTPRSGTFLCDASGMVVACDPSLLTLLGRRQGEILGLAAEDLLTVAPDHPHPVVITLERRSTAAASVRSCFGGPSRLLLTEPWQGRAAPWSDGWWTRNGISRPFRLRAGMLCSNSSAGKMSSSTC